MSTASPFNRQIRLFLKLQKLKEKKKKNNASQWIPATLILWSHPLRSPFPIPDIIKITDVIQLTTSKYFDSKRFG